MQLRKFTLIFILRSERWTIFQFYSHKNDNFTPNSICIDWPLVNLVAQHRVETWSCRDCVKRGSLVRTLPNQKIHRVWITDIERGNDINCFIIELLICKQRHSLHRGRQKNSRSMKSSHFLCLGFYFLMKISGKYFKNP